jgi:hypothetical protein
MYSGQISIILFAGNQADQRQDLSAPLAGFLDRREGRENRQTLSWKNQTRGLEAKMLERHETFISEQYRRQDERSYAEAHRIAKENGLQVSSYRKLACSVLIHSGERLVSWGKKLQSPMESGPQPAVARMK